MSRVLSVLASVAFVAAGPAADPTTAPVVIPRAVQFDLRSKAGLEYRIFVAAPAGAAPAGGYPVLYLTDANANFPLLYTAVRRQSMAGLPAVVVGIGYPSDDERVAGTRRTLDLTPPASASWLNSLPKGGPPAGGTGGQGQFLAFIEDELKPLIERKYAIDRARQALFGHSFGGLFVLHTLFTKPEAFQTYLASSPSVWWNDRSILAEEAAFVTKFAGRTLRARLLVTAGEWEQESRPGVPPERVKLLRDRRMVDNARELAERLSKSSASGLSVSFRLFAEEDHGSVVLPAASRGARLALELDR